VTTRPNTLGDSSKVDLDTFGADVDEHHLKALVDAPGISHHLQVILAGESRLDSKALSPLKLFLRQTKNLLAGRHGRNSRSARTERVCECVRVQERDRGENARVSGGKRTLSSSVCTSNDSQSRAAHRPEADASTPPRASAFCACSSSSRRRSSATFALAPAASLCAISSQSTSMAVVYYFCSSLPQKERPNTTPGTLPGGDLGHDAYSPGRAGPDSAFLGLGGSGDSIPIAETRTSDASIRRQVRTYPCHRPADHKSQSWISSPQLKKLQKFHVTLENAPYIVNLFAGNSDSPPSFPRTFCVTVSLLSLGAAFLTDRAHPSE
jgi:hypothetical protein